ncbi:hypothetical protein EDI_233910 [Entamoeba dispar SAW760]|uniref:TLDc domain-containing protein n=1 Tax=Entamoeba dispar (strain ATCC PRA-260 / SAW760) TaxID=370354 RepID=B0E6C1_ENTDS|nr:uncharacterized protein EDI_233910 [Entamoeba dispar SAW760]EDR29929.1 hypothetical protein EDI_233910 [Entamoeba dispar SAW760]|eukprot:EDR29929.1 hypothetical protein EDI_233910 [Entamoeba dispar SAW760]
MDTLSWNHSDKVPMYKEVKEESPFKILKEWVQLGNKIVIFNSEQHEMMPHGLWNKVSGRKNIMFIVISEYGDIFGSFHGVVPTKQGEWVWEDSQQFIFTMKNQYGVNPIQFKPKTMTHSLLRISGKNNTKKMFWISDGYRVNGDGKGYISNSFSRFYNDSTKIGPLIFTNSVYPNTFSIRSFFVIQWY